MSSVVCVTYTIENKLEIGPRPGGVDITVEIDLSTTSRSTPVAIGICTWSGDIEVRGQLTCTRRRFLAPFHHYLVIFHTWEINKWTSVVSRNMRECTTAPREFLHAVSNYSSKPSFPPGFYHFATLQTFRFPTRAYSISYFTSL